MPSRVLRVRAKLALAALVAAPLSGCGVPADEGLDASLMVSGGQFTAGAIPPANGGPKVIALDVQSDFAHAGQIEDPLGGALGPTATAAAIGLSGDQGYWTVPAGLPMVTAPNYPTFAVMLSFAETIAPGTYPLQVAAVDAEGRFGAVDATTLTVTGVPLPSGALVFTLRWDTEADLDLHVVDPAGVEIYWGDISPAGSGAYLDFDSNANCVIDGRREENVVWTNTPPSGTYLARVDTPSLCAATYANWTVEARLEGKVVGEAEGESLPTSTEGQHDRGAGVDALTIVAP